MHAHKTHYTHTTHTHTLAHTHTRQITSGGKDNVDIWVECVVKAYVWVCGYGDVLVCA